LARDDERDVPAKAKEVLDYFLCHPQAVDTLEGVARWRLMEERVHERVKAVNQALRWLVVEGFLTEECRPHTEPVFRLNERKVAAAKAFCRRRD